MPLAPPAPPPVDAPKKIRRKTVPGAVIKTVIAPAFVASKPRGYTSVFYHSGDAGDIIASLTAVKALGGGRLQIGPDIGFTDIAEIDIPRCRGNEWCFEYLRNLFLLQPYIKSVEHVEKQENVDSNLNVFRKWMRANQKWGTWHVNRNLTGYHSLADAHLMALGVSHSQTEPWLRVDNPWPVDTLPIVVQRSPRYQNPKFPWKQIVERYGDKIVFVGLNTEHADFCKSFGKCHWFETLNALEIARLIAGSKLFIGNQSSPFWIAEGLKHKLILEMWDGDPNCHFNRPGHFHDLDGDWPKVESIIEEALA